MNMLRTPTFAIVTAVITLVAGANAAAEDYPQPGLYNVVANVSSDQLPMASSHDSQQCIKDDQFRTDPKAWMQEQGGQSCEVLEYTLSGGSINMQLECTVPGRGASTITGTGTYHSNGWQMKNTMRMSSGGINMEINTEVTGTRQGAC